MGRVRDAARDHSGRAMGRRRQARGAGRAVGPVRRQGGRRLAPHRQADRAREEVEHPAVDLSHVSSAAIGAVGAWIQGSRLRPLRAMTQAYIQFFRNTPPLVQLYFFYFALGSYLRITNDAGLAVPVVSNFVWAAICLSLYAG